MQFDPMAPMALLPQASTELVLSVMSRLKDASILDREEEKPKCYGLTEALSQVSSSDSAAVVAVVPVYGVLAPGRWGNTDLDSFPRLIRTLDSNPKIHTIVLDVRSPGGTVMGTPEAADAVRAVRSAGQTRIISVANGMMASAATWVGTAAEKVYVTPSGEAGSIGVISMYADWSKAYESLGVKIDVMRTPDKKARFSGVEPLTEEMRNLVMQRIGESYEQFKRAMADNRGIRIDQVEKRFGGGEMLSAQEAVDAGLVDGIATLDEVLAKAVKQASSKRTAPSSTRAQLAKLELESIEN